MTRLEELNKEFDLNIDEITVKENKKINLNKRKLIPITTIEKRDFNSMLPTLVSDDCLALRLDIAKEIDVANTENEEMVKVLKRKLENTVKYLMLLKGNIEKTIVVFIDNFDIIVKEMRKDGLFLVEEKIMFEQLIRDVFKTTISDMQNLSRVIMLIDEKSLRDFVGGDRALSRKIEKQ
ncbi:hypothetical protein [Staphylococcus argenteus]|uniref:hypothetical protein n=1 Tax=Staphylococcus argenteus TaxID=985002 RepID=UPI000F818549|nr:hypothetical protein [Staphylococcus argenteus]